jgi:type VI protein secretion system component Hcp
MFQLDKTYVTDEDIKLLNWEIASSSSSNKGVKTAEELIDFVYSHMTNEMKEQLQEEGYGAIEFWGTGYFEFDHLVTEVL